MKKVDEVTKARIKKIVRENGVVFDNEASSGNSDLLSTDAHAVRWSLWKTMGGMEIQYTKWHWTIDAEKTVCGRTIKLVNERTDQCLPETDDLVERVDCKHCLDKLGR